MRTTILFCLLTILSHSHILAQAYEPFLRPGAHWQMRQSSCTDCDVNSHGCVAITDYQLKLDSDSVVNGRSYAKLTLNSHNYSLTNGTNQPCGPDSYRPCQTLALLWEDTVAKKVYARPVTTNIRCFHLRDSLLLDFSMNIGDTFLLPTYCGSPNLPYTIDSMYSEYRYGRNVKTWLASPLAGNAYSLSLHESVGWSSGLFGYSTIDSHTDLTLYCEGTDSACGFSCPTNIGVSEIPYKESFKISPIPFDKELVIESSATVEGVSVRIYDLLGNQIQELPGSTEKTTIYTQHYPPGIYLYQIIQKGIQIQAGKVIKL